MKVATRILALAAAAMFVGGAAQGASYPDHPVKIVVPFAPAGPTDVMARLIAQKLSESLKQQFYVENHPGAGGNIGMTQVAKRARVMWSIRASMPKIHTTHSRISHR
jgi:tripartite-type tricarboxylate transporter receptor subunit TctC